MTTTTIERTYVDLDFTTHRYDDDSPDLSWLDQSDDAMGEGFEDMAHDRKATYGHTWALVGVQVEATITDESGRTETFADSLWGIESDSDDSYFRDVENELTREVCHQLEQFGLNEAWIAQFCPIIAGDIAARKEVTA
jgi:hypothetical protein